MQAGAAGVEPPAPKKRGRPRKDPDVIVSEADLKGKARRGRPRASRVSPRLMQRAMWGAIAMEAAVCLQPAVACMLSWLPAQEGQLAVQRDVRWLLSVPLMLHLCWVHVCQLCAALLACVAVCDV